jgi:hypothetical protein
MAFTTSTPMTDDDRLHWYTSDGRYLGFRKEPPEHRPAMWVTGYAAALSGWAAPAAPTGGRRNEARAAAFKARQRKKRKRK